MLFLTSTNTVLVTGLLEYHENARQQRSIRAFTNTIHPLHMEGKVVRMAAAARSALVCILI